MNPRNRWRIVLIVFLLVVGVSGVIQALPHAHETMSDLLIDGAALLLIVAACVALANIRGGRRDRKKPGA